MKMAFNSVKEIFDGMPKAFDQSAAAGLSAVIQFNIEGDEGGDWYATIKDQTCTVSNGVHDNPTLSLRISDKNWVALCKGELNAVMAFMTGKLKAKGDIMLAQRLPKLFSIG
ncbi:MAG TPA: SCP2 sterol-binding domain-containing protein [Thermodesulfobacteriota bacterium]|nr:SCP2 sterol-binding domain-containing protein [Thermodesulfobacteriota bacterium]